LKKKNYIDKHSHSRSRKKGRGEGDGGPRSSRVAETRRRNQRRHFISILVGGAILSLLLFAVIFIVMRSDGEEFGDPSGASFTGDISSILVSVKDEAGSLEQLLLVSVNENAFRVISIPARTVAEVPGQGFLTLGQVEAAGGQDLLDQTVANLLQHPVQYHIEVDQATLLLAAEQVGTINLNVRQDLTLNVGDSSVSLAAGDNSIRSDQALSWLEAAYDDGSAGPQVQAAFIQGLRDAFLARSETDRTAFAGQLYKRLITDMSEDQFIALFMSVSGSEQSFAVEPLPVRPSSEGADWYFEPIVGEVENMLGIPEESPYTLEVRNGTETPGVVEWAAEKLAPLDIDISMQTEVSGVNFEFTQIRYGSDAAREGNSTRELLGAGTLIKDDYLENNQIIVIIGLDLAASAPGG
jgi:hypothetical protein